MRKHRILGIALGGALLLAGCSAKTDDASKVASITTPSSTSTASADNSSGKTDEDKMREFAKCMREHGIDMPDPTSGPNGERAGIAIGGDGADQGKMDTAQKACKQFMPNGGEMKPPSAEELDKMRQQAKCMREHGIDMPDPDPTGKGGAVSLGSPGDDQTKFEAAAKACGLGVHTEKAPAK